MFYKKRLNNNVVVAVDSLGNEQILCGKGLGFNMEAGNVVEDTQIEKVFTLKDMAANHRLQELCETIPAEYVALAKDIVSYACIHIDNALNENVIVSLCDHIYMAIQRKQQDIDVKNVMLWDIKKFYRDEFAVGEYAVKLIEERFEVTLNEDEAGFIALHIVNSQLDLHANSLKEITQVMQEIETIVRMTFAINIDINSVYYYRFITHLKFFAERLFSGNIASNQDVEKMLELVKLNYVEEYSCAQKVGKFLVEKYSYELSAEEILYLSIHISRIVQVSK